MDFSKSRAMQEKAHELIPGGAHTYARGSDQYPELSPGFMLRGSGCRSVDLDGNEFVEYGMGLRAVTLGHAFPSVTEAVCAVVQSGTSFVRPHVDEVETAETLLSFLGKGPDYQVKFAKNGSDVTTAAIKLARAHTGRDLIGICGDHPFFSSDDWFIGTTPLSAGIPDSTRALAVEFPFNDLGAFDRILERHGQELAAIILELEADTPAEPGFLEGIAERCRRFGIVFIADEIINAFRLANGGAQELYSIQPHLSTFAKGLGNGVPISALVGRRELMELGGLRTDRDRVFLLSSTYGGDRIGLAAARAVLKTYSTEPVIEHLWSYGQRLRDGFVDMVSAAGLGEFVGLAGRPSNLLFWTKDRTGERSQPYRTLFMQELIARGVLGPSFVDSYAHDDSALDQTLEAVRGALGVYSQAIDAGTTDGLLVGPPTKPAFRRRV